MSMCRIETNRLSSFFSLSRARARCSALSKLSKHVHRLRFCIGMKYVSPDQRVSIARKRNTSFNVKQSLIEATFRHVQVCENYDFMSYTKIDARRCPTPKGVPSRYQKLKAYRERIRQARKVIDFQKDNNRSSARSQWS